MLTKKEFKYCMTEIQRDTKKIEKFEKDIGKYFENYVIFDMGYSIIGSHLYT